MADIAGSTPSSSNYRVDEINDWLQQVEQKQASMIAAAAAQRAAQQQWSPSPALQSLVNSRVDLSRYMPEAAPQQVGPSFKNSFGRGVDQVQQSMYGAVGLLGDLIGSKDVRDWGLTGYLDNQREIDANPRVVGSIADINSLGTASTWAKETIAEQLPNLIGTLLPALATGGATAGLGMGAAVGANLGMMGSVAAMEAGNAYGTDATTHGANKTSPWADAGVGLVNAGLERLFGLEGSIIKRATGQTVTKEGEKVARGIFAEGLRRMATGSFKEGSTEALQEITQAVNENLQNDLSSPLTTKDTMRILDSFAAGALLGGFGGLYGEGGRESGSNTNATTDPNAPQFRNTGANIDPTYRTFGDDWTSGAPNNGRLTAFQTTPDGFLAPPVDPNAPPIRNTGEYQDLTNRNFGQDWTSGNPGGMSPFMGYPDTFLQDPARVRVNNPAPFATSPDTFYSNAPRVYSPDTTSAPFGATPDTDFLNQANPGYTPFESSPDNFYLGQPARTTDPILEAMRNQVAEQQAPAPFQSTPDQFLGKPAQVNAPFAKTPDQFLQQTPRVSEPLADFQDSPDSFYNTLPTIKAPLTPMDTLAGQAANLRNDLRQTQNAINNKYTPLIDAAKNKVQQLVARAAYLNTPAMRKQAGSNPAILKQAQQEAGKALVQQQAIVAALQERHRAALEESQKTIERQQTKLANNLLSEQEIARQQLVAKDPFYFSQVQGIAEDTKALGTHTMETIRDSLAQVRAKLVELQNMLSSTAQKLTPKEIQRIRAQIRAAESTQMRLNSYRNKATSLSTNILERATNPRKFYNNIQEAQADFDNLRTINSISASLGAENAASPTVAPVVNELAKAQSTAENLQQQRVKQQATEVKKQSTNKAGKAKPATETTSTPAQETQSTPQKPVNNVQEVARKLAEMRQQKLANRPANGEIVTAVSKAVSAFTKKFQSLAGRIQTVWAAPIEHANDLAFIDNKGNITLIASNIEDFAKRNSVSVKDVTTAALQHEGIAHYGLRTILTPEQLSSLLNTVYDRFSSTQTWKDLEQNRAGFANQLPARKAEEFIAHLAERAEVGQLSKPETTAWTKIKALVKNILDKLGFTSPEKVLGNQKVNISEADIINLLKVGAQNLTQKSASMQTAINENMGMGSDINTTNTPAARSTKIAQQQAVPLMQKIKSHPIVQSKIARQNILDNVEEAIYDSYAPVHRMVEELKSRGLTPDGKARVDMQTNLSKVLEVLPNQTAAKLSEYWKVYVEPVQKAIAKIGDKMNSPELKFAKASDYLEAKASLERNKFAREHGLPATDNITGIPDSLANETISRLESPAMKELATAMRALQESRLKLLETKKPFAGADEAVANWRKTYEYYMPFKNWDDVVKVLDPNWYKSAARKNLSVGQKAEVMQKRALGREGQAQDPIVHSILQLIDTIAICDKADAGRVLIDLAVRNKDAADVLSVVEKYDPKNPDSFFGMKRLFNKKTMEVDLSPMKHSAEGATENTILCVDRDGNPVRIMIEDPAVARALRGDNIREAGPILRTIGGFQRILAKVVTSISPLFWMRNPIRDTITAAINMTSVANELKMLGVPSSLDISKALITKGIGSMLGKKSVRAALMHYYMTGSTDFSKFGSDVVNYMSDFPEFIRKGAQSEYFTNTTYNKVEKDMVQSIRDLNPRTLQEKGMAIARNSIEHMEAVSNALENMTRYIAFKEMVNAIKGANENINPSTWRRADGKIITADEIYSRSANVALNLTVNFSKKGSWAPIFNSWFMFASASIAGNARMLHTMLGRDPKTGKVSISNMAKFAAYPLAAYTLQATLSRMLMPDDDDGINQYDKIPEYIKNSNLIIPSGNEKGGYVTIPLPYGFNVFWAMARNISDSLYSAATGKPGPSFTKAAANTVGEAFDNFSGLGQTSEGMTLFAPSVLRPLFQLATNKNFAGNPIYPEGNPFSKGEVPNHTKYWSTANESVVAICKAMSDASFGGIGKSGLIDVSPESLEHLTTSYLGGLGRLFFGMAGRIDDLARGKGFDIGKMPGANVFYKTPQDSDTSAVFSELRKQVLTQKTAIDEIKKDRTISPEERSALLKENAAGMRMEGVMNSVQKQLNNLRKQEHDLSRMDLSVQERTERIDKINAAKKAAMMRFNKAAIAAGLTDY